jgi:4-amino-4-deoxy-L-arabinose transferase-like glycosyltransferase
MYYLFLLLTVAAIISQTVHTFFIFDSFSRLKGRLKLFQAIVFCSIISVAIFAFVIIGKPQLALLGAIIEVVINIYYYAKDYFEDGITTTKKYAIRNWWRRNWISMFFGIIIPALIYVFSLQLIELK